MVKKDIYIKLNYEYELDSEHVLTGRFRVTQFIKTLRYLAVPPSQRQMMNWSKL